MSSDVARCNEELDELLHIAPWGDKNQIGLNCRNGATNRWYDAVGGLSNANSPAYGGKETDFTIWNIDIQSYIRGQLEQLKEHLGVEFGRIRIMRLMPHHGLSIHRDHEVRYHLVLKTNNKALFGEVSQEYAGSSDVPVYGLNYHIPMDGNWYEVDTTKYHWVYNGGEQERIHLVVCGV
jgi:hypothetical protein